MYFIRQKRRGACPDPSFEARGSGVFIIEAD
jgi:hypothetical protein